jgi:hypothetical protein
MRAVVFLMWIGVLALPMACGKFTSDVDEVRSDDESPDLEGTGILDLESCRQAFSEVDQTERETSCRLRCEAEASHLGYCSAPVGNECERTCLERLTNTDRECASCILDAIDVSGYEDSSDCPCCLVFVAVTGGSNCEPGCTTTRTCRAVIRESHTPPENVGPQPRTETAAMFPLETIHSMTQSPSGLALAGYDESDDAALVFATRDGQVMSQYNIEAVAAGVLLPQLQSGGHWITSSEGVWYSDNEELPTIKEGLHVTRWKLSPERDLAFGFDDALLWVVDTKGWESTTYALPEGLETAVSVVWAGADGFLFNGSTGDNKLELTRVQLLSGELAIDWKRQYSEFSGAYTGEFFESDTGGGAYRLTGSILTRFGATGEEVWSTPVLGSKAIVSRSGDVYAAGTDGFPQFPPQEQVDPMPGCSVYGCAAASLEKYNLAGELVWHSIRRQEPSEVLVLGLIPEPALIVKTFDGEEFANKLLVFDP